MIDRVVLVQEIHTVFDALCVKLSLKDICVIFCLNRGATFHVLLLTRMLVSKGCRFVETRSALHNVAQHVNAWRERIYAAHVVVVP